MNYCFLTLRLIAPHAFRHVVKSLTWAKLCDQLLKPLRGRKIELDQPPFFRPTNGFETGMGAELLEDMLDVIVDGRPADEEYFGYFGGSFAT